MGSGERTRTPIRWTKTSCPTAWTTPDRLSRLTVAAMAGEGADARWRSRAAIDAGLGSVAPLMGSLVKKRRKRMRKKKHKKLLRRTRHQRRK